MVLESQREQHTRRNVKPNESFGVCGDYRTPLRELIQQGLSEQERLVVLLHYSERLNAAEIGQVLDLSEARVRQLYASILSRLRAQVQWQGRPDVDFAG